MSPWPRATVRAVALYAAGLGAFALCAAALAIARRADLAAMTDLGLVSVLPPVYFVALAALTITFTLSLRRAEPRAMALIAHLAVLVVMLYAVAPLLEETTRTAIAWKLRGITDYIVRTGRIDPDIDAFFNWPGFFILSGFFTQLAGIRDTASSFPAWAPVFFNLLYLAPLFMMLRTATADPRAPWLGTWFFCLANWIGQDYLAPQAINYFLFLVLVALLLKWFARAPGAPARALSTWLPKRLLAYARIDAPPAPSTPAQRAGLMAIVVVVFAAIVPSHQLTPMATIAAVSLLVVFNRLTTRGLPALMIMVALAWISYMAVGYLAGHFEHVTAPVGAVGENLNANLTDRFRGSAEHQMIAYVRSGTSAFIWCLALVGAIRRARRGRADATLALLAVVPFLLLPLQAYGGELLLRVYLFSLPAMVFFAAAAFLAGSQGRVSWRATVGVAVASMTLAGGFLLSRYGDERMQYFSPAERAGVRHLYESTPSGARFIALNPNVPWQYREYDTHRHVSAEASINAIGPRALIDLMKNRDLPTYLVVTRSQLAAEQIVNGRSPAAWAEWKGRLLTAGLAKRVFANAHTEIFVATKPPKPAAPDVQSPPFQRVLP